MCCTAVAMLVSTSVLLLIALAISARIGATAAVSVSADSLSEFLPELVCKRLHVCGSAHIFQLASKRNELLAGQDTALMRHGTLVFSGTLEMTCEDMLTTVAVAGCLGVC